jgi:N-acylneuraminate cytidylyltransferase
MPEYSGYEIDEPDDWIICESLMKRHVLIKDKLLSTPIKLFLTDVDGVLTDAGMYYSENGDEIKKFNTLDGKAFELLRKEGIKTGIITSECTKIVERRAQKIRADYLYQGIINKLTIAEEICKKEGISLNQVAFIGDDINDFELLSSVGLAAVPPNGIERNKKIPNIILLKTPGGNGAVREFVSKILSMMDDET